MEFTTIQMISVWALPIIFAVTVHEVSHGYVAYLLGDRTAQVLGRLTLNPIKHIDLVGTIIVPGVLLLMKAGVVLGWAKPVPVDSRHLSNPRRDMALIAAAGPMANLMMAIIWAGIAKLGIFLLTINFPGAFAIYMMSSAGISINLMLMILNLLPIPQLDGGHIVASLLPHSIARQYERLMPYGLFILLGLLALGVVGAVIRPIIFYLYNLISLVFGLPALH